MRLLFVQESDWLKRNPAQQHHLAEMLSLRGHEVRVIDYEILWKTNRKRSLFSRRTVFPDVSKIHKEARVTVIRPGMIRFPLLNYFSIFITHRNEIEKQIKEFQPEIIVGWGIVNTYLACRAAKRNKIPFIYYWIDVLDLLIDTKLLQGVGKLFERQTLKCSDKVLVINEKLADYVLKLGAIPGKIQVLKAGINPSLFNANVNSNDIRVKYSIKDNDFVLLFMGWIYHFAGIKEVALQLTLFNSHVKLIVVGEGDGFDDLTKILEKNKLAGRLILTGRKDYTEIPRLISAADVCLLPAYPTEKIMQDIVPIKTYEYLAMGKPVISTKLPGVMREFGLDNGVVYIEKPEDAIQKAIELKNNNEIKKLGLKGISFVNQYSWNRITDLFEDVLISLTRHAHSSL